ncbi:hypothetical protein KAK06_20650 [Ideonella sp. 4Y11]|uniref:Uncharacterized protein n=1 Tax=Ideonella aquatica TaxID=2824119 RepID=A0A941BLW2_9BURK|nr:hypothetical protein [Ideonella aquatica]MBQ0961378.1 hypothetical protein [Ideonella aquatica]
MFRCFAWPAVGLVAVLAAGGALAATPVAYVAERGHGRSEALLVELRSGGTRASVVSDLGRGQGGVSSIGGFQVITLDVPVQTEYDGVGDCDGLPARIRRETQQIGTRVRSGKPGKGLSEMSYAGTDTILDGCDAGKVVSWGGFVADQGIPMVHRSLASTASLSDLVPGVSLAGLSAAPGSVVPGNQVGMVLPVEVVSFGSGQLSFATTGVTLPYAISADGWLSFALPAGGQRGYLRLTTADSRGMEQWMSADMSGGVPQAVWSQAVIKPVGGAAWGTGSANARIWESAIFEKSMNPFYFHLYRDGTGERVQRFLSDGTEQRSPLSAWYLDGDNLVTERTAGSQLRRRVWQPIAINGKAIGVLEAETYYFADGSSINVIPQRVNAYIDEGKAVKPAAAQVRRAAAQSARSSSPGRSLSR